MRKMKPLSKYPRVHLGHLILLLLTIHSGCSIYSTFPPEEANPWIKMSPSDPPVPQILAAVLIQASSDTNMSKAPFSLTETMDSETYIKVRKNCVTYV